MAWITLLPVTANAADWIVTTIISTEKCITWYFRIIKLAKKVYSNKVHSLQRFTAASFIDLWELFDNVRTVASWQLG